MSLSSLTVSSIIIVGWCIAAQIARSLVRKYVTREGIVPILFNEAIAAAELCACCFELIIGELCKYVVKYVVKQINSRSG